MHKRCRARQNEKTAGSWNGGTVAQTGTGAGTGQIGYRVLGIYLNDHLAGATAGTELAHRWSEPILCKGKAASSSAWRPRSRRTAPP